MTVDVASGPRKERDETDPKARTKIDLSKEGHRALLS